MKNQKLIAKIKNQFENEFSSSPQDVSEKELEKIIECDCECDCCGKNLFEMDDFPVFRDDRFLCPECEIDKYFESCPICQEHFEKAENAKDFRLLISKEAVEDYNMEIKPGFYLTNEWPFYYGNCVTGFDAVFPSALHLVKECDINSMLTRLNHGSAGENLDGEVCHECFKIWTGQQEIENNYVNQEYGAKYIALQSQIIAEGF